MKKRALIIFAIGMALIFSACSRQEESSSAGQEVGGELRFGFTSEPATLDPLSPSNTADGRSILFNVFEGLVKTDSAGVMQGAAAESFTIEENGLVYSFVLREGLKFSDGSPVTPQDAAFTIQQAMDARFYGFTQIDRLEIVGERGIKITLKAPDVEFLPNLSLGIVPAGNLDREKNPIGTGPYMIESYDVQQSLVLTRNPHYWKAGYPILDRVTIVFSADSDALFLGLQGGNIDGAVITSAIAEQLDPQRFDIIHDYSNSVQLMALNNAFPPLDKREVREAINYGIDVEEIIATAFYGRGEPSGSPMIPGLSAYYEESLRNPYLLDRTRARRLLADAGYPNGFDLEITVPSNYTMHVDTAQVAVNLLAEIGIRATIKQVDWATWLSDVYRGRNYEATIISLDSAAVSPRSFLSRYVSGTGSNFLNFNSPEFDRVYQAALTEVDDAKRAELYREAQRIISGNSAAVYIQDIFNFKALVKGKFGGFVNYPLYVTDFSTVYRRN